MKSPGTFKVKPCWHLKETYLIHLSPINISFDGMVGIPAGASITTPGDKSALS